MTTKIGLGDLESTDQRGRVGAAEDIELIDRMREGKGEGGKTEYLAGVGDSLAPVVIRACHILELIYKKILPLDMTVKKNYLNVDEIKPDVYSAAKGLCGDGTNRVSLRFPRSQPEQSSHLQRYNQPEAQSRKQRSIERLKDNDSLDSELNNQVDGLREGIGSVMMRMTNTNQMVVVRLEIKKKGQDKIIPTILERGGEVDLKTRLECKSCLSDYTRELWSSRLTERMRIGSNTRQRKTYTTKNLFKEDWPKHREMVLKEMEYLNLVKGIHKFLICDEDSVQVQLAFAVKISKTKESERRRTIEEECKGEGNEDFLMGDLKYLNDHIDRFIKALEGSRIRYLIEDNHNEGKL
ncbi:hypothetical protein BY996DRAFT_6576241 [Phakopsora pachyrhizi]|nr:hypothetical protein BY996DRAFT_6576241 [Phakopsora pachyrhizi]